MIDFGFGVKLGPLDSWMKEKIREWRNDPEIWHWCRQNDMISDFDQDRWFEAQSRDPTIRMYAIHDDGATVVGVCGLTSIDHVNRNAEFSLYIAPNYHGNKLGEKALKTLVAHGFRNLGLHHIFGETFQGNKAYKIFQDVGFRYSGTRRKFYFRDGRFINADLYDILSEEFNHDGSVVDFDSHKHSNVVPIPLRDKDDTKPAS